jgi:NAD(P)-dependent dehydrogenase (short-subunit alcohol dehydrogenase family)
VIEPIPIKRIDTESLNEEAKITFAKGVVRRKMTEDKWTTDNIPDLTGKVIIVTGANVGLGYESAKEFARKGAQTIMACRSMEKGNAALSRIKKEIPNVKAEVMHLDLASLKSIHSFSDKFKSKFSRLDVLLNNAGIMMVPHWKTDDGFEKQFGVNHLGHFALTGLFLELILKTPASRVVNVSSTAHRFGKMDWKNLMYENNGYGRMRAYGRSKLANLLFTYELQRRFEGAGANCIAVAAHPGIADTQLGRYIEDRLSWRFLSIFFREHSAAMGALPQIRASVGPNVKGGEYYGPVHYSGRKVNPVIVKSNKRSHNMDDARRLWQESERLTGVKWLSG